MSKGTILISILLLACLLANVEAPQSTQSLAAEFSSSINTPSAMKLLDSVQNTPLFSDQYALFQQKLGSQLDNQWQQKETDDKRDAQKLQELLKKSPENPQLLASLALVELKKNNTDKAAILYGKAKILDPLLNCPELEELSH